MEDTKEVSITTTRRVFHAVVVTPKGAKGKGKVTSSRASSDSTVASTRDSPVVDLDTPATSVGDSPEPRLAPNFKIGGRSMNAGTKRKRGEDVARGKKPLDTTAQDEEIARQLQQQEYDSESSDAPLAKKCGATGKGKATAVYDSDEESALSELDFVSSPQRIIPLTAFCVTRAWVAPRQRSFLIGQCVSRTCPNTNTSLLRTPMTA